jgi:recombination protein RecA
MAKKEKSKPTNTKFDSKKALIEAIQSKYGPGAVTALGAGPVMNIPAISTGSAVFDDALGVGGVPVGRVVEVFGLEGGGKTTLCLSTIKECQKQGGTAAFVDAEHALDPKWAQDIGVNVSELMLSQPNSGEEALSIVEMFVQSGQVDLVVVDSVAALVPQAEIDGEMGDSHIGLQARLMSQACRKLTPLVSKYKCTVIFINQIRMKIGVMFGNPETTPGGNALKFYSSVRLDIRRKETIKEGDDPIGNKVTMKVIKNKVAPPFKSAISELYYGKNGYPSGFDYAGSLVALAKDIGIVTTQGSWYNLGDMRLGNGYKAVCDFVRNSQETIDELTARIKESRSAVKSEPDDIEIETLEEDYNEPADLPN